MIIDYILLALKNLKKRGVRSWLTMLGIFLGIAAVVSLISLGQGLQTAITGQFGSLDADKLIVENTGTGFGPPGSTSVRKLTEDDVKIIESVSGVDFVIPRLIRVVKVEFNKLSRFSYIASIPENEEQINIINDALNVASIIKEINPNTKIIFGGPHPTVMPNETLQNKCVDAVIIGEGELTLLELIKNKGNFETVGGIWFKKDGKIIRNSFRPPNKNIDEFGFPLLDKFPMEDYIKVWFQLETSIGKLMGTNILMSRGCPFNCSYCQPTLRRLFGNVVRTRSAESVIEELKYLKKRFKINSFFFDNDTFAFNRKIILELCDLMIKEKLD